MLVGPTQCVTSNSLSWRTGGKGIFLRQQRTACQLATTPGIALRPASEGSKPTISVTPDLATLSLQIPCAAITSNPTTNN